MESDRLYKILFYAGAGWNFTMSIGAFVFVGSLPSMIGIAPPLYPVFIYFNLMSVFFFGWFQLVLARELHSHRSFVKLLIAAKLAMAVVLVFSILQDSPAKELIGFLAPGVIVDVLFGLIFWRFLVFSSRRATA